MAVALLIAGIAVGWLAALLWHRRRIKSPRTQNTAEAPAAHSESVGLLQHRLDIATARLKVLTENITAAIIIQDVDGSIVWVSPFTEILTGYSVQEILSQPGTFLETITHEEDRDSINRAFGIVSAGEAYQYRFRFYHKSGLMMWAEVRAEAVFDQDTQTYTPLSIMFDVTTAVNQQQLLEERNRDLHDFTYMVSHDLKAPINTLTGMLTMVREETEGLANSDITGALSHCDRALKRLNLLVQGILELAKTSSFQSTLHAVDLDFVCRQIFEELAPQIQGCKAETVILDPLPPVIGSELALNQIFTNLITNSLKYAGAGNAPRIEISCRSARSPRKVTIIVSDNGPGIPEEQLQLIFKPFQRLVTEEVEGTGVGLASVKKLVEKLGGAISVSNNPGGPGCSFAIELRRGR